MKIKVDDYEILTSERVDKLPREFVDFAVKNRTERCSYCWESPFEGYPAWRLDNIQLIARPWSWILKLNAISLKFAFIRPKRNCIFMRKGMTLDKIDELCFDNNYVEHESYFVNLIEGEDIHEMIVKLNLDLTLPPSLNHMIIKINGCAFE